MKDLKKIIVKGFIKQTLIYITLLQKIDTK